MSMSGGAHASAAPSCMGAERQWRSVLDAQMHSCLKRIMGLCCGNVASPRARGSFDRAWWAWRAKDMPNASLQYGVYPLALAWKYMEAPWGGSPALATAVCDGLEFWCAVQHRAGSFSQLMPNEHSFGTTAYTVGAVLEAVRLMDGALPKDVESRVDAALVRAGEFLLGHGERYGVVANHIALFAWGYHALHRRTGDERHLAAALAEEERLLAAYDAREGWFLEYDGADPGYQTQCLQYMVRMQEEFGRRCMGEVAADSFVRFLQYFFHPDGSFGGVYGSRATSVVYPGALFELAPKVPEAAAAADWFARSLERGALVEPGAMDDENVIRLTAAYLHTFYERGLEVVDTGGAELPCRRASARASFPRCGIEVVGGDGRYTVVGLARGGAFCSFGPAGGRECDAGYVAELASGRHVATQLTQPVDARIADDEIVARAEFVEVPSRVTSPWNILVLRLANLTLMRVPWVGDLAKALLVRLLITARRGTGLFLERRLTFDGAGLVVEDRVRGHGAEVRNAKLFAVRGNALTMASADYCQVGELGRSPRELVPGGVPSDAEGTVKVREISE